MPSSRRWRPTSGTGNAPAHRDLNRYTRPVSLCSHPCFRPACRQQGFEPTAEAVRKRMADLGLKDPLRDPQFQQETRAVYEEEASSILAWAVRSPHPRRSRSRQRSQADGARATQHVWSAQIDSATWAHRVHLPCLSRRPRRGQRSRSSSHRRRQGACSNTAAHRTQQAWPSVQAFDPTPLRASCRLGYSPASAAPPPRPPGTIAVAPVKEKQAAKDKQSKAKDTAKDQTATATSKQDPKPVSPSKSCSTPLCQPTILSTGRRRTARANACDL